MGLKTPFFVALFWFSATSVADPYPPEWANGTGAAIHYAPVAWPSEPDPQNCGTTCGDWKPYTRFQNDVADARTRDLSNGGTAPQSYVNVASSCADKALPSIYYYLHRGVTAADDVLMFRWRVEAGPHNYATGPSAGNYSATNPWSSALWTVFFDLDGSGYRSLAAHLDGSIGGPAEPIDRLAGIWGDSASHSLDYANDPNVYLLGHNPTAFIGPTNKILNFQSALNPVETWPNGAAETSWDYGTTRAKLVSKNSCTEYFVDYQIPIAMLDASDLGGPAISRSTPIAMMFCTANSLNNPLQKDCAVQKEWLAGTGKTAPFGDYLSFDQTKPYSQPIIAEVKATPPDSCPGNYQLTARVQDTLALNNGVVQTSVQAVDFYYWFDANGDGEATAADISSAWIKVAGSASQVSGTLNRWSISWDATGLRKGRYLVAVQALDDNSKMDDGMTPSGINNRTFSYMSGDATNEIYINGAWSSGQQAAFLMHSPALTPSATENWYGNPDVTGNQISVISTAINVCGLSPAIGQAVDKSEVGVGETVEFTVTVTNPTANPESAILNSFTNRLPDGFTYIAASTSGASTSDPASSGQLLTWNLAAPLNLAPGDSSSLSFSATASTLSGVYNNSAGAVTSLETLSAEPLTVAVDSVRLSVSVVPDTYSVAADDTDTITFTINYANDSTIAVYAATIITTIEANSSYVSCSGGNNCAENAGTVTWNIGDVPAGFSGSVTYTLRVGSSWATPSLTTTANLSGSDSANNPVNTSASAKVAVTGLPGVTTPAALSLRNTASAIQIAPGASVTYTLAYHNYGETAAANTTLTDTLPTGMAYTSCSGSCNHVNGIVSWTLGTVAAGASGSVTMTATAAGAPFTAPNPTTNGASISWTGGTPVTATAKVGVTGQACNDYYFSETTGSVGSDGTRRLAVLTPVPSAATAGSSVTVTAPGKNTGTFAEAVRFYQDPAATSDVPFSGNITTKIYIDRSAGPALNLRASVYDYNSTNGTKVLLGQNNPLTDGQFNGSSKGLLSVVVPTSGTLAKDHRLLWIFEAQSNHNTTDFPVQFQYGGTVANSISGGTNTVALSGASFCVTPPANLILSTTSNVSEVDAGSTETVIYTVNYANTGSVSTTSTTLVNTLPTGFTNCEFSSNNSTWSACSNLGDQSHSFNLGTVAGGTSGTVYVRGAAPAGSTGGSTLSNISSISSTQTSQTSLTTNISVMAVNGSGGSPELAVSYHASTTNLVPGNPVTYTTTVINTGGASASNVSVTNLLPIADYFSYVSCSDSCSRIGNTLTWTTGTLAAGASRTYTHTMLAGSINLAAGITTIADDASVNGDGVSAISNNVSVSLSGNPQLALGINASPTSGLSPGDAIGYSLTVTNNGSVAASQVQVFSPIPTNSRYAGGITTSTGNATFDTVGNRVVHDVGSLAAGASATLAFLVSVSDALVSGTSIISSSASAIAANAQQAFAQVNATATAEPQFTLTHSQTAASAYPTAQLTAAASNATQISVDNSQGFTLGQKVQIGGSVLEVVGTSSTSITLDASVTAASGTNVIGAIAYTISYLQTGNAEAINAVLTETLPAGLTYYSATPAADSAPNIGSPGDLVWNLGTLAPDRSGNVEVVAFPSGLTGALVTTATLEATNAATATANVTTTIGGLSVRKTTTTPLLNAGDTATYTITLSNSLSSSVTGVAITDLLPQGFGYSASSAEAGGIAVEPDFDIADLSLSQPTWTNLTVPANGTLTLEFDAVIAADTGAGIYQNELQVSAPVGVGIQNFDPLTTDSEDVTVLAAGEGRLSGYVFQRDGATGTTFVAGNDIPLEDVTVEIYQSGADCTNLYDSGCFVLRTNSNGYFSQIAASGTWTINVISGTGQLDNSWLQLVGANDDDILLAPQEEAVDHNGFGVLSGTSQVSDFSKTLEEDTSLAFTAGDFTAVFTDINGGNNLVTLRIDSLPSNGTLTLANVAVAINDEISAANIADLVYTPTADYYGADSFQWNATDGLAYDSSSASVVLTITDVADPGAVTINDVAKSVAEDAAVNFAANDFLAVFTDSSGGSNLTHIRIDSLPSSGTLTLDGGSVSINDEILAADIANLTYTPNSDYFGSDSFQWNAHDGAFYAAASAAVNITVTNAADPGTVSDISRTVAEDGELNFTVADFTAAFTDSSGGSNLIHISIESLPIHGTLTLNNTAVVVSDTIAAADIANLVYSPDSDYAGSDSFQWNAYDGVLYATSAAQVDITVTAVADPGTVSDINRTVNEDTSLTFTSTDFTTAFIDSNGGSNLIHIRIDSLPSNGTLTLDGAAVAINDEILAADIADLTYTPNSNYFGGDSFQWNAYDGVLYAASSAVVNITVTDVADPGTVSDFNRTVAEDSELNFTSADFTGVFIDSNGGSNLVHIRVDSLPSNGTLTLAGAAVAINDEIPATDITGLSYTPDNNYFGNDSFQWNAYDGVLYAASSAVANITVTDVVDPGTVSDFNRTVAEDSELNFSAVDFIAEFIDSNGGSDLIHIRIDSLPSNGTLTLDGAALAVSDEILAVDIAQLTYIPDSNYFGSDSFQWNAFDGTLYAASSAAVNINITDEADPGTASDFSRTLLEDSALTFSSADFKDEFVDSNGGNNLVHIRIESLPANGSLVLDGVDVELTDEIAAADIANLVYVPAADFAGSDSFHWTAFDGMLYAAAPASVHLTVTAVADPGEVTINNFAKNVAEDTALILSLSDFTSVFVDSLGGNDLVLVRIDSLPTHGTLTLAGDAVAINDEIDAVDLDALTYTPDANYNGADTVQWNAYDGSLYSTNSALININITAVNDRGSASDFSRTTAEDTALTISGGDFANAFSDPDEDDGLVRVRIESLPEHGILTLYGFNVAAEDEIEWVDLPFFIYTPDTDFNGSDNFQWNASDGELYAAIAATVNITVTSEADPGSASNFSRTTDEDTALTFAVADFAEALVDSNGGNTIVYIRVDALPSNGALVLLGNTVAVNDQIPIEDLASLTYTPGPDYNGLDSFQWSAYDGVFTTNTATVNIIINAVADPGEVTIGDIAKNMSEDTELGFTGDDFTSVLVDSSGGNNLQRIRIVSLPINGQLQLAGNAVAINDEIAAGDIASLAYLPSADFNGSDSFQWNAYDGSLYATASAAVNITVTPVADAGSVRDVDRSVAENSTLIFSAADFRSAFTDSDGGSGLIQIRIDSLPVHGSLVLNGSTVAVNDEIDAAVIDELQYHPDTGYFGPDSFQWNAFDGALYAAASATVNITVTEVADPGSANNISRTVVEDSILNFSEADFREVFTDSNGGSNLALIRIISLPAMGTLTLDGTVLAVNDEVEAADLATLQYTPYSNYSGPDNFSWLAYDGQLYAMAPALVNITVTEVADPGNVMDIARTVAEGSTLAFSSADFADAFVNSNGGHNLQSIRIVALPENGSLWLVDTAVVAGAEIPADAIADFIYRPADGYYGADSFEWNASDGALYAAASALVTITITEVVHPGSVSSFARTVAEDSALAFATADFRDAFVDGNGGNNLVHIRIDSLPLHGTLTLDGNAVTQGDLIAASDLATLVYTPEPEYSGSDIFLWSAYDDELYSASTASVNITVTAVADPGTVSNFARTVAENTTLQFTDADFAAAFIDTNGGSNLQRIRIVSLPNNGALKVAGVVVSANTEVDAADLTTLVYTPNASYTGSDSFQWNAYDGAVYAAAPAQVLITVTEVAIPGRVASFNRTVAENTSLNFFRADFRDAFTDSNGGNNLVLIRVDSLPTHGTLLLGNSVMTVSEEVATADIDQLAYVPDADYNGPDSFTWSAYDGALYSATPATVSITVTSVTEPGSITSFSRTLAEDTVLNFSTADFRNVFVDSNGSHQLVHIRIESLPANGVLALDGIAVGAATLITAAGLVNLTYTPDVDYNGTDSFVWRAHDGEHYSANSAAVNLVISAVPDAGNVSNFARGVAEDDELNFGSEEFTTAFTGANLLHVRIDTLPSHGVLTLFGVDVAAGDDIATADLDALVYLPDLDFNGDDYFQWRAYDGVLYSANIATVTITVTAVADAGTIVDISKTLDEDSSLNFATADFREAFRDSNGTQNLISIRIESLPQHGTLTLNGQTVNLNDGIPTAAIRGLVYTPAPNYFGTDSFLWNAFDGEGYAAVSAAVNLGINDVTDGVEIVDGEVTIEQSESVVLDVIGTLPDNSGAFTIVSASSSYGTVEVADNQLIFTPDPTLSGIAEVVYLVNNGNGGLIAGTVLVNIIGNGDQPDVVPPADITINATALYTKVNLGVASALDRFGNGLPVSLVDGVTFFEPGANRAFWQTTDASGNRRVEMQRVRVRPLVSIEKDKKVLEGRSTRIGVYLNGLSPEYPLVIPYSVAGTAGANDHTLTSGEIVIRSGTVGHISLNILSDAVADSGETIQVTLAPMLNRGNKFSHTLTIAEGNVAPNVTIEVTQDSDRRLLISRSAGTAVLRALTRDDNENDQHTYQWRLLNGTAVDQDNAADTFTLDSTSLTRGLYVFEVRVTDNGSPPLSDTERVYVDVVEQLTPLRMDLDSDFDLIPDAQEGYGDIDSDGIPDYLDARDECNVLHEGVAQQQAYLIEGDPGVCLRKGAFTVEGESGGALITSGDFSRIGNRLPPDPQATNVGGIFDYLSYGLPEVGQSYRIVIPQRLPIPDMAVYRKFQNDAWGFFIEDGEDEVASAPGEQGFCPPPGGDVWQPGLTSGHWCVQLTLRDGGPNDDDGISNGAIVDPGGVGVLNVTNAPPQTTGQAITTEFDSSITINVLESATDTDGDELSVLSASADFGTVLVNLDGSLIYTPPAGFAGTATITYSISDGNGGVAVGTVTITVLPQVVTPEPPAQTKRLRTRGGTTPWPEFLLVLAITLIARRRGDTYGK